MLLREQLPALAFVPSFGQETQGQRGAEGLAEGMACDLRSNVSGFRQVKRHLPPQFPVTVRGGYKSNLLCVSMRRGSNNEEI